MEGTIPIYPAKLTIPEKTTERHTVRFYFESTYGEASTFSVAPEKSGAQSIA